MKEVITIKMVEQTTVKYVADDGKEFNKEFECKGYELSKRSKEVQNRFELLDRTNVIFPIIDEYKSEGCMYKITFNNREDLNAFVDYYVLNRYYMDYVMDQIKKITYFPYTTIVDEGCDGLYFVDEKELRDKLDKFLIQLDSHNKTIPSNI